MEMELMLVLMKIYRQRGKRKTLKMLKEAIRLMIDTYPERSQLLIALRDKATEFIREL